MAEEKAADPKAALAKYTYPGADKDDAAIKKVETAIAQNFPAAYTAGLAESANNAPIKEDEVHGKIDEAKQQAASEAQNNPDAKKEVQEGGGSPKLGAPVKPAVKQAGGGKPAAADHKKGAAAGAPVKKPAGKAGGGKAAGAGHQVGAAPSEVVLAAAATGDASIDEWLDKYPNKSHEPTEHISKIKEMASVAKGFDGQLENYVDGSGKVDSASAKVVNFLGKKEFEAAFGENPYAKVEGGLGTIMRGISRFANVVSIVGNVCGKLGMVLTVVGLLGMVFPPIGAAVSAVARVLNVVGIICDALGLVLSGILTGLNGVVLAKQIAKGASNEEKAATADLMVSEATSAGGHVLSLAMSYGPGFMKGFKAASKNVIGRLFAKFKTVVGKFASKTLGPVANWAKNIGYKVGIGLEKEASTAAKGPGLLSKAWHSPGTALEKLRDTKAVKFINNSKVAKGIERFAGRVDKVGWVNKVDGIGESLGKKAGSGAAATFSDRLKASAEDDAKAIAESVERNAGKDAANRERERINHEVTKNREVGNNELADNRGDDGVIPQEHVQRSDAAYNRADELERGQNAAVAKAEKEEGKAAKEEYKEGLKDAKSEERLEEKAEKQEEARVDEFKRDPKKFQNQTEAEMGRLKSVEKKLENPSLTEDEKKKLEHTAHSLEKTIQERKMIGLKASGGEAPETLWQAKKQGMEIYGSAKTIYEHRHDLGGKDEKSEKLEQYTKRVEKASGHAIHEEEEKEEHSEQLIEFQEEQMDHSEVAEHVDGMLLGLDEELGFESEGGDSGGGADEEHEDEHEGNETASSPAVVAGDGNGNEPPAQEPKPAAPVASAPANEAAHEKPADPGELAYWPKLTGENGDFMTGKKELFRMKQVAYAFKKQQEEARKKAYEAATTYSKSGEDAEKKADHARTHTAALHGTIDEAKNASSHADQGTAKANEGSQKQGEGSANGHGQAQQAPDPGEKPSRWHPIKRIWWYVKKWASEKAAAVFGWIQEKIASMVLQGLCGVSMGDMRAYTEALHHRMEFSKMAGTQGVEAANRAMAESAKTKNESKSYEQQALDDAAECDQNMADADTFARSVEQTEQDLVAEQARARAFLDNLKAAVAAERQQKAADKAKKAQEAAAAVATAGVAGMASTPKAPKPRPQGAADGQTEKKKKEPKPVSVAATGKVKNAATYVVTKANTLVEVFVDLKNRQNSKLQAALGRQPEGIRKKFDKISIGDGMVAALRTHAGSISSSLGTVKAANPTTASELHANAGQVKSNAKQLDEAALHANEALNEAFKATYKKINDTQAA